MNMQGAKKMNHEDNLLSDYATNFQLSFNLPSTPSSVLSSLLFQNVQEC